MLTSLLLVAVLGASPAPGGAVASVGAPDPGPEGATESVGAPDPVHRLRVLTERARRTRDGLSEEQLDLLRATLGEIRILRETGERSGEIDLALVDLASLGWISTANFSPEGRHRLRVMADLGQGELERRFRRDADPFCVWLATQILDATRNEASERRLVAAHLLRGHFVAGTQSTLLRTARSEEGALRDAALAALAGWPDNTVHYFFLDTLEEEGVGLTALSRHLDEVGEELGPGVLDRLRSLCGRLYVSEDWRDAARARHLVGALDTRRAVPLLIEALNVWHRRGEAGQGSKRIQFEILAELQRISGRAIGPVPERWLTWWQAVLEGRIELPEEMEETYDFISRPAFFGLRPVTDKVVFIVDRSGSMESRFGTNGRTRYQEAMDQLVNFLQQSGTETHFAVVLFSDKGVRWRSGLVEATPGNLELAERWLRKKGPDGGTRLREGLREALHLDRRGRLDADRLDVDTVVVLCDGATAEGPAWVEAWMLTNNEVAQVAFHCAEIGASGDGTLETLAELSGGDYVRLDG